METEKGIGKICLTDDALCPDTTYCCHDYPKLSCVVGTQEKCHLCVKLSSKIFCSATDSHDSLYKMTGLTVYQTSARVM